MFRLRADTPKQRLRSGALVLVASVFAYSAIQHLAVSWHRDIPLVPETRFDAAIPFLGWALIPYASLGVLLLLVVTKVAETSFRRLVRASLIAQAIAYVIFLVWPMAVARPAVSGGVMDGLALWVIEVSDLPVNTVPSLHVAYSVLVIALLPRPWYVAWAVVIIASVLPMKQHMLLDLLTGIALGVLAWRLGRASTKAVPQSPEDFPPQTTP